MKVSAVWHSGQFNMKTQMKITRVPFGPWKEAYNHAVDTAVTKYAASNLVTEVDLNTGFPADDLSPDKVHPNDIGYNWMASRWFDAISFVIGKHPAQSQ